jgi:hypothetical protein
LIRAGTAPSDTGWAFGQVNGGYQIIASGRGSFAFGYADGADIQATAQNAWQFGVGINAVADSLQIGTGFRAKTTGQHAGVRETVTLGVAAATFAIGSQSIEVTGDAGANAVTTITGAIGGQFLLIQFVDALVTIVNDDAHTADTIDLVGAVDFVGADDSILLLWYDGTSWYEVSRSVN